MRVGLSWDLSRFESAEAGWPAVMAELEQADQMGFDSAWLAEGREGAADCSSPSVFMTYASRRTRSIQLRSAARRVGRHNPVRIAEEIAVLDTFSRGRAGIAFAAASGQGAEAGHVHEMIDFVTSAWTYDELRYRGEHVRFPAHTPDDAPPGASEPSTAEPYTPQWEWGPVMPDFLAVTPKPYAPSPPVYVDIADPETRVWAAEAGVSPWVGADVPTSEAVERLASYRRTADEAGRSRREVEAVLERRIALDGASTDTVLGGSTRDIVEAIRAIRVETGIAHIVWHRDGEQPMDLYRFASEIQTLLQA